MWRNATEEHTRLLGAVANGDKGAFTRLFYLFHQELGEFVYRLTKSREISEEIVQEVFIKVWTQRENLLTIRSFRAYLFIMARNHTFNALRDETRKMFLSELRHYDEFTDGDDASVTREELYQMVEKAVALLPPQQQKVWKMSKEEGLPHQKIAELLNLSPLTVKRHVSLAMASVIRYVKNHSDQIAVWMLLVFQLD